MKDSFVGIMAARKDRLRKDSITFALGCINGHIETCMENEIDLLPESFPADLVDALAALHSKIESLSQGR